jgi:hypothetical protein
MGVVIEMCIKYPGGPTRMTGTDIAPKRLEKIVTHTTVVKL